ncbi:hypothetical protein GCM10010452_01240 [Crossiella cryophila]
MSTAALLAACGISQAVEPSRAPVDDVDLYLMRGGAELVPGGSVERAMTVINHGRDMVGNVELFYTTPILINIDGTKKLPDGCAMYYQNKDYRVPEVVKCTLPPLKHNARVEVSLPLKIYQNAPPVPTYGAAIARPADAGKDRERNITDNIAVPGGVISLPAIAANGQARQSRAGSRLTLHTSTAAVPDKPTEAVYRIYNMGDQPAPKVRLQVVTSLYVNTSTAGPLPAGCGMVLKDPDPAVPEIVDCEIGDLAPGKSREFRIPVKAVPGGPIGQLQGVALVTRGGASRDALQSEVTIAQGMVHGPLISGVPTSPPR